MKWLKDQGADLNVRDDTGKTPLDLAYELEKRIPNMFEKRVPNMPEVIEWLKANGAVVKQIDIF